MKATTILFLSFISIIGAAQDTIKYNGIIGDKLLYDKIELYPDSTFVWTSEYDLSFSSYGNYKIKNNYLTLDFYFDFTKPETISIADSIANTKKPTRSEIYLMSNGKMYKTNEQENKKKRIKDQSLKSNWSWIFGHKYVLVKEN